MSLLGENLAQLVDQPQPGDLAHIVLQVHQVVGEPPRIVPRVHATTSHLHPHTPKFRQRGEVPNGVGSLTEAAVATTPDSVPLPGLSIDDDLKALASER